MFLLFSVRFMRIGVERLWSAKIRAGLNERTGTIACVTRGAFLGFVMQGATAVMLLVAGLAGSSGVSLSAAALMALGADLGSAIAVQFLQLPVASLSPLLVLIGCLLYLRAGTPKNRNLGRVILDLGLIFLSLKLIRAAVEPTSQGPETLFVVAYLNQDLVSSALLGLAATLIMYSSIAAILTIAAFAGQIALDPTTGVAFMLGCNFGSSLLPVWLLKEETIRARNVAKSVALVRCGAAFTLFWVLMPFANQLAPILTYESGAVIVLSHLAFNAFLMLLAPLCRTIAVRFENTENGPDAKSGEFPQMCEATDTNALVPNYKRHVSSMLETLSSMIEAASSVPPERDRVLECETSLNLALARLREVFSALAEIEEGEIRRVERLMAYGIKIERCGDMISGSYLSLQQQQINGEYAFSKKGRAEIDLLLNAVRRGIALAQETTWAEDPAATKNLVEHKQQVTSLEAQSRTRHLDRLRQGNLTSLGSSDQHLEIIATLKETNSKLATIGYAVLDDHGALKGSRIKKKVAVSIS